MIQNGSYLNVIDNSGAKKVYCIKVISGYKRRYAFVGDLITVAVQKLRSKRRIFSKTKKGEIYKAIIVRIKKNKHFFSGDQIRFFDNSVVLLNKQSKYLGTRVFGIVPRYLRFTKYLKVVSLSSGVVC